MWISSVSINNFRCFSSLSLTFKKGLNILVGENSAGKSTLFVSLSKLFQSTQQGPDNVFTEDDLRYGKSERQGTLVQCKLELDRQEQKQLLNNLLPQPLPLAVQEEVNNQLASALENVEVTFTWQLTRKETYVKLGPMFVMSNWVSDLVRNSGTTADMVTLLDELRSPKSNLESILHTRNLWSSQNILKRIGELLSSYFKSFTDFRYRACTTDRSNALESFSGSETASVLLNLKNNHALSLRKRYDAICTEFSKFFPFLRIEAVENNLATKVPDVQFIEEGRDWPIPLANVGSGVTELLTFLTNLVGRENCIFVIEEPELHLHPQAKRRLNKLIKESAKRNQVFIITHDPYFVCPDDIDALIRFYIMEKGTQTTSLPKELSSRVHGQLKTAMKDPAKREILFARAVILVEDESQYNFITAMSEKLSYDLDRNGLSVIFVDGSDGFEPYLKLLDSLKIPKLCLRDLSWGSADARSPQIFRSLGCELEQYLENAGLGSLLKQAKSEVGSSKPRMARYIGEHIKDKQVPPFFLKLIADAIQLCGNQ